MKLNLYTTLLICLFVSVTSAQSPPNDHFSIVSTVPCPFDSTQTILQADDWLIYQTLNDEWNGPIDSTKCIGLVEDGFYKKFDLDAIDATKPFFIRSLMDDSTKVLLEPNFIFIVWALLNGSANIPLDLSGDCANGICSGFFIGVEIPDEAGTGTDLRMHPFSFQGFNGCDASVCFATEKFENNYLKEFVFKVTFESTDLSNSFIRTGSAFLEMVYDFDVFQSSITAYEWNYNDVDSTFYIDSWFGYPTLLLHGDSTYPSPDNIYYYDVNVEPSSPDPQNIVFTIGQGETFILQPYTSFQGGLVEGSDSIRHNLTLINDGGDICFPFVEVSFGPNSRFVYNGGNLNFGHPTSCLQFQGGAKLVVPPNNDVCFGHHGMGILALRQGSTIEIGMNSTLTLNNLVNMFEHNTTESHQIYMELNPGSTLIFGEYAHLSNQFSVNKEMKLNIYMNGGVLDDSGLSAEERLLINKIYPDNDIAINGLSTVVPNPIQDYATWVYNASSAMKVNFQIYDIEGVLLWEDTRNLVEGQNQIALDLKSFDSNVYFLNWQTKEEEGYNKILKF